MEKVMHETARRLFEAAKLVRKEIDGPAALARALNQSEQTINNWSYRGENGVSRAGRLMAQKELGISATWIEDGTGAMLVSSKHNSSIRDASITPPKGGVIVKLPAGRGNTMGLSHAEPGLAIRGEVPLISWDQARTWDPLMNSLTDDDARHWLPCPAPHSAATFCIENNTETMDDGTAKGYREGEILFVDPEVQAVPDKDIVVILPNGKMLFRRLKEDGEGPYLLALNGKRIERWEEGTIIRGVVIFSGVFR
jgi:SOS-response transcriptional repressor LexA